MTDGMCVVVGPSGQGRFEWKKTHPGIVTIVRWPCRSRVPSQRYSASLEDALCHRDPMQVGEKMREPRIFRRANRPPLAAYQRRLAPQRRPACFIGEDNGQK